MSDAADYFLTYFLAHAVTATRKARELPSGRILDRKRTVARVYHLLAKAAAQRCNLAHLDDFRTARRAELSLHNG